MINKLDLSTHRLGWGGSSFAGVYVCPYRSNVLDTILMVLGTVELVKGKWAVSRES